MTDDDRERVHRIIQQAVCRAGGDWKRSFKEEVDLIDLIVDEYISMTIQDMSEER